MMMMLMMMLLIVMTILIQADSYELWIGIHWPTCFVFPSIIFHMKWAHRIIMIIVYHHFSKDDMTAELMILISDISLPTTSHHQGRKTSARKVPDETGIRATRGVGRLEIWGQEIFWSILPNTLTLKLTVRPWIWAGGPQNEAGSSPLCHQFSGASCSLQRG